MSVRRLDLAEAVSAHVADGDCVWLGNFGTQLFAVGRQLIEQGRRDLHVVIGSGGLLLDQLIDAGVVAEATFSHCWSPVGPHSTRAFRAAWEQNSHIRFHELSLATLDAALGAAAAGVPFAAVALAPDSDYLGFSPDDLAQIESPFGSATVVRALRPDVAFAHALCADAWGNAALGAPAGEAPSAIAAAQRTVVVAEELCDTAAVAAAGITVPGVLVDAVVEFPGAAHPDGVAGRYPRDVDAYERYAVR